MIPENPTQFDTDQLVELAVTAAGPLDNPTDYAARVIESMAVLTELALPDLANQIISAAKETSKAGNPFNYFINGILREVSYDKNTSRGHLWIEPARIDDAAVERARNGEANWKLHTDGTTPLERFPTERLFFEQGRAVYRRAQQLVNNRVTIVKYVYSGRDSNNHREAVAIMDRGPVPNAAADSAPAPAPAPEAAPEPAPADTPTPEAEADAAPEAAPAVLVGDVDVLNADYSPTTIDELQAAYAALGFDQPYVRELAKANNISSATPEDIAALWNLLRDQYLARADAELAAALNG